LPSLWKHGFAEAIEPTGRADPDVAFSILEKKARTKVAQKAAVLRDSGLSIYGHSTYDAIRK